MLKPPQYREYHEILEQHIKELKEEEKGNYTIFDEIHKVALQTFGVTTGGEKITLTNIYKKMDK